MPHSSRKIRHDVHLDRQPQEMMDAYLRFRSQDFLAAAVARAAPVTVELYSPISRQEYLQRRRGIDATVRRDLWAAVCDRKGVLHEAEQAFVNAMQSE